MIPLLRKIWGWWAQVAGVVAVIALLDSATFFLIGTAFLNALGPSTRYEDPIIVTATRDKAGENIVYLGDNFVVNMRITRFELNGTCTFAVKRYAEFVGGPYHGQRLLISTAVLHFQGKNDTAIVPWPVDTNPWHVGMAMDSELADEPVFVPYPYRWDEQARRNVLVWPFNDMAREGFIFIPEGESEQRFTFYVVGRYFCNRLDHWFPRYIQGGDRPNITPRIDAIVRRHKP